MRYISKGAVVRPSTEEILFVNRCGSDYALSKPMSTLWLEGRFGFAETRTPFEDAKLAQMSDRGLVEIAEAAEAALADYRMLVKCVVLPAKLKWMRRRLSMPERRMWQWINQEGLYLTTAELVFLAANGIRPSAELLGRSNFQNLTALIYNSENIHDNILEATMESADGRDSAVATIMALLRKKRLVLV